MDAREINLARAVAHGARRLAVLGVDGREEPEVGVRAHDAQPAADKALLVEHKHAVGLDDGVEAVEHGAAREVGVVEDRAVAVLHGLDEDRVAPDELAVGRLHEAAEQVGRVAAGGEVEGDDAGADELAREADDGGLARRRRADEKHELLQRESAQSCSKSVALFGKAEQTGR